VTWQGQVYTPLNIKATGFEVRADGPRPRPQLLVGDIFGSLAALVREHDSLYGARLYRKRTHARYLDAVNFAGGVNPDADATAAYDDELWIFDRIISRDGSHVLWELVSPIDLEGVLIPARTVDAVICGVAYRSSECGYAGGPVAKADDTATTNPALDRCSRRISGCKLRFGATAELPAFIFPGAGRVRRL
jgi:lambda family phage minor tail protein L